MLSGIVSAMAAFFMIASDNFAMILLAMGINAVSYNLVSGTREALTYDSLLVTGQEEQYLKVASRQDFLYEALFAFTSLMSVVTVSLGYKKAYLLGILQGILCTFCASLLKEAVVEEKKNREKISLGIMAKEVAGHFVRTAGFLRETPKVAWRMAYSGLVSAAVYVVYMLLQDHLVSVGLEPGLLGIPLLLISLCTMAGAVLAEKSRKISSRKLYLAGGILTGLSLIFAGRNSLVISVMGGGIAHCVSEVIMLRTETENQKFFSSESRATMVSAGSMAYSVFMTILSPGAGALADVLSVSEAFALLGLLAAAAGVIMFCRMRYENEK